MTDFQAMLCAITSMFLLYTVRAVLLDRAALRNMRVTPPSREPAEIGWCFVTFDGEDELSGAYGFVTEMTIGGEPWIRVSVPDPDDGFIGNVLRPLAAVREFALTDEETCRKMAAEDQADDDVTELPPIGGQVVAEDKPN